MSDTDIKETDAPRKNLPSSYYHIGIIYPDECNNDFKKLGCAYVLSPLHTPDCGENGEAKKEHRHILFRAGRKMTGISFQGMLYDKLGPDFSKGFSYSDKHCVVTSPTQYLRYMVHLDDFDKQQFKLNYLELEQYGNFDKEILNAFDDIITSDILRGIRDFKDSVYELSKTPLYCLWLRKSSNLYLYNTIRKEVNNR